jgi:5-methylcytosine-specific restriction protein A
MPRKPDHHRHLDAQQPWRAWYKTARWQKLKLQVHIRDGYICQRTRILCLGKHPAPDSPVANHKTPHKGDSILFWDIENIETIAKSVHDGEVQAQEKSGILKGTSHDGRPTDPSHPWSQ